MNNILNDLHNYASLEDDTPRKDIIPLDLVMSWIESNDFEMLSALWSYISDRHFVSRIKPPISVESVHQLFMRYFELAMLAEHQCKCDINSQEKEKRCHSYHQHQACWDMTYWFNYLWKDKEKHQKRLLQLKKSLTQFYLKSGEETQACIVNAALEHMFENKKIAGFFKEWKKDPLLEKAYRDAMLWSTS